MNNLMCVHEDPRGIAIEAFDELEVRQLEFALVGLLGMEYDPLQHLRPKDDENRCFMSFILECIFRLSSMEGKQMACVKDLLAIVESRKLGGGESERLHLSACKKWVGQDFEGAHHDWRLRLETAPRDILALYGIHMLEFNMGWPSRMRKTMQLIAGAWKGCIPLAGYVKGMEAFALVENGESRKALSAACQALDVNPRDIYALHAAAHVHYETGNYQDGSALLDEYHMHWSGNPSMRIHVWWHYALFKLYMMDIDTVLSTFHEKIRNKNSLDGYEDLDAVSLLWRLSLIGIDVSALWQELAQYWMPGIDYSQYWFNDVHAMMAMTSSNHLVLARRILCHVDEAYGSLPRVAAVTKTVCQGLLHFGQGDYSSAFSEMASVLGKVAVIGGSNAQRDLLEMTCIEAALRSGRNAEAHHLLMSGRSLRHPSPLRDFYLDRLSADLDKKSDALCLGESKMLVG